MRVTLELKKNKAKRRQRKLANLKNPEKLGFPLTANSSSGNPPLAGISGKCDFLLRFTFLP